MKTEYRLITDSAEIEIGDLVHFENKGQYIVGVLMTRYIEDWANWRIQDASGEQYYFNRNEFVSGWRATADFDMPFTGKDVEWMKSHILAQSQIIATLTELVMRVGNENG